MNVEFTNFPSATNWVKGLVGKYKFEAKLYDEDSEFGINGGRISKLCVYSSNLPDKRINTIINFDRGWDMKPTSEEHKDIFAAVLKFLENSPKRCI